MKQKMIVLLVTSIAALAAGILPEPGSTEWAYHNLTWYFMLVAVAFFAVTLARIPAMAEIRTILREHYAAFLLAAGLVACAALFSPPEFKILADETNLLGVSMEMHEKMRTRLPLESMFFYHGMRTDISFKTEMRPAGFPFVLSLLHNLTGYRPGNVFILNLIFAWLSLLLLYALVTRRCRAEWGMVAMLGMAAFPVFVQCATSGGFEIFNLMLALAAFLLLDLHLAGKCPSSAVLSCLVLLAYSRYESILALVFLVPVLLVGRSEENERGAAIAWVFPILLPPALWLRRITWDSARFQVDKLDEAFSSSNFMPNLEGYLRYFTSPVLCRFVGPLLLAAAITGGLFWLRRIVDRGYPFLQRLYELALGGFFISHLAVRLFYTQGNPLNNYTARLTLIFIPALVLLAVFALKRLEARVKCMSALAGGLMVLMLLTSWPAAAGNAGANYLTLYREFKWVARQLTEIGAGEDSIVVCARPNLYVPLRCSAVTPEYAQNNAAALLNMLKIRAYRRLILVENVNYSDSSSSLPLIAEFAGLQKLVIFETQLSGKELLKITALSMK